ncbi:MAG: glutathione S-transferase [Bosea sp.]|uniref:glutathione S-transferase n=1 Tax=Bosea sp. (in: a-proteobacteria) TaxID=1871050 RepID=UPI001ACC5218|nr:glutathione S-transferase [Bosea sp. (in: a-proteobacteria)]MBN9467278.1 glutathione S-transferase [Bosea sp. (in: a-proteobacteria)]
MKLFFSPQSPYVRKVLIVAHELGCLSQIETVPTAAHPVQRNAALIASNPLGQIPALELADGRLIYDSRVICDYLNETCGGAIVPATGPARWRALTEQALGDGMLAAALLARYETAARPPELRWPAWLEGQLDKAVTSLDAIERDAASLADRVDIGTITIACALGYLDLRFPDFGWRERFPRVAEWEAQFAAREALRTTAPLS